MFARKNVPNFQFAFFLFHNFLLMVICLFVVLFLVLILFSTYAQAAVWPVQQAQFSQSLPFHSTYTRAGKAYTHQGMDVTCCAGTRVVAPVSGQVSFVGNVPSGDSLVTGGGSGQTMQAVSIKMQNGKTLTLSPMATIALKRGAKVSEGTAVGTLAASGDRSSTATHLHVGLKENGTYYDPMTLFSNANSKASVPAKSSSAAKAGGAAASSAQLSAQESSAQHSLANKEQSSTVQDSKPSTYSEGAQAQKVPSASSELGASAELGTISSGNVSWQPASEVQESFWQKAAAPFKKVAGACKEQLVSCKEGLQAFSQQTGVPLILTYFSVLALLVLAIAAAVYAIAHFVAPKFAHKINKVNHKAIAFLLKIIRGDSMQKLFPASGDAFMPRGR